MLENNFLFKIANASLNIILPNKKNADTYLNKVLELG